ncbi:hypothetical protein D3C72_1117140 [compost metagenome]
MSRIETLREQIKIVKSMSQSSRQHQPIVIAVGSNAPNSSNGVRAILGQPLLMRNNDGSYVRDERGFLIHDQMATYKANRGAVPSNYSLDDLKYTEYLNALATIPVSEAPFRKLQLRPRKSSPYEMAKWGGILWGGRTDAAATEYALRQEIQKTIPKAQPYLVKLRYYRNILDKDISAGRLCKEIMWVHGALYGLTPKERKLQEIIDDRFHVDPVRLSTSLTSTYAQLPIDSRFAMSLETYAWASRFVERPVHNSTGHWD